MAVEFITCHASGATGYAYVPALADDIVAKMQGIGFEVVSPVSIVGVNADWTMGWHGYEFEFGLRPGSYSITVNLKYAGTTIASLGNTSICY